MSHTVVAELVANVQQVTAKAGDTVGPETTLVILESMKMEIPVLAEVAGTIREMKVAEGEVVRDGDPIAIIEEN
ncbi:biotin/lipoyl-binding carrier protein [Streptomyces sp. SID13031]|uniref:biotin/lipoyl-binding carrier protein n=1 Tax=Streptomyces sp. SID13031 TaxID=2706046 RepID=UPI0013CDD6AF|nr:biotin/lipoyl-binding carrier protein [Streptomyces sp. SID13031]